MIRNHLLPAALLLAGCGGHSARYQIDDQALAQLPMSDKQSILDARNEVTVAKSEKEKAASDVQRTRQELSLARSERQQAGLEVDKAKVQIKMADTSKDFARKEAAEQLRRSAELGKRAAESKVDMLEARLAWQRAVDDMADAHLDAGVSRIELEKAKLAAARNIRPSKDFDPARFASDYEERARRLDQQRIAVDKKHEKYDRAAASYGDLQRQYENARPASGGPAAPSPSSSL